MNAVIQFLAAPFAMCLVLAGIHCYLGLHVLARGVIFVDLSLAQVATLGSAIALLANLEHHTAGSYFLSLSLTLLAALLFATARRLEGRIPQEALIGIVYAFASAAVILILDRTAHGAEELKEVMVGQILLVSWSDVGKTLVIYLVVGFIHFLYRKKLIESSFAKQNSWRMDFLFYTTFGVVITSSTQYAGVLLVFALLIVPALLGRLFFSVLRSQLFFGWAFGALFSFLGVYLSYVFDAPVGAFIVVLFTSIPILIFSVIAMQKN